MDWEKLVAQAYDENTGTEWAGAEEVSRNSHDVSGMLGTPHDEWQNNNTSNHHPWEVYKDFPKVSDTGAWLPYYWEENEQANKGKLYPSKSHFPPGWSLSVCHWRLPNSNSIHSDSAVQPERSVPYFDICRSVDRFTIDAVKHVDNENNSLYCTDTHLVVLYWLWLHILGSLCCYLRSDCKLRLMSLINESSRWRCSHNVHSPPWIRHHNVVIHYEVDKTGSAHLQHNKTTTRFHKATRLYFQVVHNGIQ